MNRRAIFAAVASILAIAIARVSNFVMPPEPEPCPGGRKGLATLVADFERAWDAMDAAKAAGEGIPDDVLDAAGAAEDALFLHDDLEGGYRRPAVIFGGKVYIQDLVELTPWKSSEVRVIDLARASRESVAA